MVVLLDEFDELVREREVAGDLTSRFLTTAMLPKIAALHGRKRIVYLVATNHLEKFDAAISRRGRFDVIVPVMPPSAEAKLADPKFAALKKAVEKLESAKQKVPDLTEVIGDLTYGEAEDLAAEVAGVTTIRPLRELITRARTRATLNKPVLDSEGSSVQATTTSGRPETEDETSGKGEPETWKDRIRSQQSDIRGLGL
jgi:SpoVK/Ycf46/Vps4 family AAA+-type ATPase